MEYYKTDFVEEEKIGADNFLEPVTIADRTASTIIVEGLAKAFPNDGILSEEEPDIAENRLDKKRVWIIDPLDGTKGFINKNGDFAVQIGLAEKGESILGVVFLPNENAFYYASKNDGAFLVKNDETPGKLQTSDKTDFQTMDLAVSRNHRSRNMNRVIEEFGLRNEISRGSVGLKIGLIARANCRSVYSFLAPHKTLGHLCAGDNNRRSGRKIDGYFRRKKLFTTQKMCRITMELWQVAAMRRTKKPCKKFRPLLSEFGRISFSS